MSELALSTLPQVERRERATPSSEWLAAAKRARFLSWLSLVWMGFEGGIALFAGIAAGSIALIGFGIDSTIEGVASVIIIWRFTGARMLSHAAEERAQKLVAIQFFLLAPYVGYEAISNLISAERPEVSVLGMLLTTSSLIGMPLLGRAKQKVALKLGSQATHGEGTQNLLCAYLAAAVLAGLLGNALFGAWWLDPLAAMFIAGVALKEGFETWRGEGCCAAGPGLDPTATDGCQDECCRDENAAADPA
jgi:divalent metal cation (Fe/Co/Zn/Cd) transporter